MPLREAIAAYAEQCRAAHMEQFKNPTDPFDAWFGPEIGARMRERFTAAFERALDQPIEDDDE